MGKIDLPGLIGMAYEMAVEPELRSAFLTRYAEATEADVALIQVHHLSAHGSELLATSGLTPRFAQSYHDYYSRLNVWREHGRRLYVEGRVVMDEELCPRRLLRTSEFYNDYLRPMGGVYGNAAVIARDGDDAMVLTALRGESREPFEQREREMAEVLLPHLKRAQVVQQRLSLLEAGGLVLDSLPVGVVFVTAEGRAIFWNKAAERILRAGDGLTVRDEKLCASDGMANARLRSIIQHAASKDRSIDCPAAALVPRPSLRRSYHVVASPLMSRLPHFVGLPAPAAVIQVTDPEQQHPANAALLKQMYGLTPKEAAVVAELAAGKTVEQAAEALRMRYETARTHLRRVFSKTGTSRQAELVLLVRQLPGRIEGI